MEKQSSFCVLRDPSRLRLKDFGGQAWFRHKKTDSKVHGGRSKVQVEGQETMTMNDKRAPLLGVPGRPRMSGFRIKTCPHYSQGASATMFFLYRSSKPIPPLARVVWGTLK